MYEIVDWRDGPNFSIKDELEVLTRWILMASEDFPIVITESDIVGEEVIDTVKF